MVSESEIVTRLREFLRTSDLNTTTGATVRRKLEEDLGIDLSDKKAFVREQIDLFLESQAEATEDKDDRQSEEGLQEADDEEEEEEDESKASLKCENDDEIDEEEEAEEKISKGKKSSGLKRCNKQNKEGKKRGGGGFTKICSLSPQLQKLIGVPEMARTEVVKQLWTYIRGNNLQDPSDRRNIICDEQLHAIFRVKVINMFQMNKSLAKHIWPLGSLQGEHDNDDKEAHQKEKEKEKVKEEDKEEEEGKKEENSSKSRGEDNNEQGKEHEETSTRKRKAKKEPKTKNKEVKKSGGGFTMLCSLSPKLQSFTGVSEMARTQVVKFIWSYIKEKNLQDPSNKRNILCDETLHALFGVNSINMFQMNKALAKHIWPLEREDDADEPIRKKKRKKERTPDSNVPLELSDALVDFLGTDESALSQADVEKRIWQYIEQNDLQDPSDEKKIKCDEKLKELFEVDFFEDLTLSKLITNHLTNIEL